MELVINLDEALAERAAAEAERRGTTLPELLVAHLRELLDGDDRAAAARAWAEFTREHAGRSPEGWKFDREECHRRDRGAE